MLTATYEHFAGTLLGYVEEVGADEYLNAGASRNLQNLNNDVRAMEFFARDKFYAAKFEARYGFLPWTRAEARQRHGGDFI